MMIGDRIKRLRNFRGLTQKELGMAIGFSSSNADIRIAQYESGTRSPKENVVEAIAKVLEVNPLALRANFADYTAQSLLFMLFELDDFHSLNLKVAEGEKCPSGQEVVSVSFPNNEDMNILLADWLKKKAELKEREITQDEYDEWKYTWPVGNNKTL